MNIEINWTMVAVVLMIISGGSEVAKKKKRGMIAATGSLVPPCGPS
jgi:hypothetical protein